MIVSLPSRGLGAAVFAVGLMLAGCSSDSDVPEVVASAPDGGTQINTDTGSGGNFPDINAVPNQRPTSTIQDLVQAPEGLPGAQSGTQYGEALVGGPSSTAVPPAPPPPPEPPQQELAPIPEAGIQTEQSDGVPSETPASADAYAAPTETPVAPVASNEPIATPEIVEPQPMEPIAEPAPAPNTPQGQTIEGTTAQPDVPDAAPQPEPVAAAPQEPPAAPTSPPQPSTGAVQQAQVPSVPNSGAARPEAYGIAPPGSAQPAYATTPPTYGAPPVAPASPAAAPGFAGYGQPSYTGQPVGLIYFRDGSSDLSSDDQSVLKQIADIQRAHGAVVNVIGHASISTETADADHQQANQRISEARASAVGQQLMEYGVPHSAIRISAVGASQPLYSEATSNGEAANRRVEIYLSAY